MASADVQVHAQQFPRQMSLNGLRVREDTLYSAPNGQENKRVRKCAEKALKKLDGPLRQVLRADETIFYIAYAQAPISTFEQLTLGWYTYRITRTALVFTNLRILHFLVNTDGSWKRSLRSLAWGDVAELKVTYSLFSRNLALKYRSGKKQIYWGVRTTDAKNIKLIAAALLPASAGQTSAAHEPQQLCPECLAMLSPGVYSCAGCGLEFKDERTLTKISLLAPGGGYFYVGQKLMGVADFLVEAYLLVLLIATLMLLATRHEQQTETLITVMFLAGLLALEKWGTIHHCRRMVRDYIPKGRKTAAALATTAVGK